MNDPLDDTRDALVKAMERSRITELERQNSDLQAANNRYLERARAAEARVGELVAVLKAYEAWEASLILAGDWSNELPRMTQAQFDELLETQTMRNAALAKVSAP
jgi:hypothetical protein